MGGNVALNPHNVLYNNQNREYTHCTKLEKRTQCMVGIFIFRDTCEEYSNIFCEELRQPLCLRI